MESYAIIIPEDFNKKIQFLSFKSKNPFIEIEYNQIKGMINKLDHPFDWFDATRVYVNNICSVMYCDDVGLCSDDWRDHLNSVASMIYDDAIAGDVILLSDHKNGGSYSFTLSEAYLIHDWIDEHWPIVDVEFISYYG